jgi:hypothetical protein
MQEMERDTRYPLGNGRERRGGIVNTKSKSKSKEGKEKTRGLWASGDVVYQIYASLHRLCSCEQVRSPRLVQAAESDFEDLHHMATRGGFICGEIYKRGRGWKRESFSLTT